MKTSLRKLFGLTGVFFLVTAASAQDFAIDWFTLDSGGGTSTGGEFAVSGAILQPEADPMNGGHFSLTGEFLSLIATVAPLDESTTIFDNLSGGSSGVSIGNPSTMLANMFCLGPQSYSLESVTLLLSTREPNNPPVVWLDIYSNDPATGRPAASTGVIMNLSEATNPITLMANGGETPITWVPATPFILSANQCYWAVLTVESGEVLYASSFSMPTGPAAAFGRSQSPNGGATWAPPDNTTNRRMRIEGTASTTPPPVRSSFFLTNLRGAHVNPPNSSDANTGGGALLHVDLNSGAWSLSGAISNMVYTPMGAAIHGPAPVGQNADPLFDLGHNFEPEGPLDGAGVFTAEQLEWLESGLLYANVPTTEYPDGQIRGQFVAVPADETPPGLLSARGSDTFDRITVRFNEVVGQRSATNPLAYEVRDATGKRFVVANVVGDGRDWKVVLALDPVGGILQPDTLYTVRVTGVMDWNLNEIAPGSEIQFRSFDVTPGFVKQELGWRLYPDLNLNYETSDAYSSFIRWIEGPLPAYLESARLTGFIAPRVSGNHSFFMSSHKPGKFWLSTDFSRANLRQVAEDLQWNTWRNYTGTEHRDPGSPENRSERLFPGGIPLVAGQMYAFAAAVKEGKGGGVAVAWQAPGDPIPANGSAPLGGINIAVAADPEGAGVTITSQPQDVFLGESAPDWATFSVIATGFIRSVRDHATFIQWEQSDDEGTNWTLLPGANASNYSKLVEVGDPGALFRARIYVPGALVISDAARLVRLKAAVIFANTDGSVNGQQFASRNSWLAGKFCLGSQNYTLNSVTLFLSSGDPSGQPHDSSVRLQIYSHDPVTGKPSANTGAMMTLSGAMNPITLAAGNVATPVKWIPATPFTLSANECYWAVLSVESGADAWQAVTDAMPTGEAATLGRSYSQNAGASWTPSDPSNYRMLIQGTVAATSPGTLELAADGSTTIPGGTGNFTGLPLAPGLSGDNLVFYGVGSGGQQGLYLTTRGLPGEPTRIADLNTPIPSGTGNFLSFGTDTEAGIIIVIGNVLFTGRGSDGQQGIYLADGSIPSKPVRIADTTTSIPGGSGNFTEFGDLGFNGSDAAFVGHGSAGQQGIYLADRSIPPNPVRIADTATAIPGGSGTFTEFPYAPSLSSNTAVFAGNGADGQQGVYASIMSPTQVGPPVRIADTATAIPGGTGHFSSFGGDRGIIIVSGNTAVFGGSGAGGQKGIYGAGFAVAAFNASALRGAGGPLGDLGEIIRVDPLFMIADTATAIPGGTGNFTDFGAVSLSGSGVAFLGMGANGQTGIYELTHGELRKVISVGEAIQGRTIAGLNFSREGLSEEGVVAFQATFTDGSDGLFTIDLPPSPAELRITAVSHSGTELRISFPASSGQSYVIESRAELTAGAWTEVPGSRRPGAGDTVQITLPTPPGLSQQFYRVRSVP